MKLFLIGMMGTGKSYWAQKIAALKNIDWMDLDAQIEKDTSMTIKEIFEVQGEKYFRDKEAETLRNLATHKNIIIATGGGTPCFNDNMEWMNEHGTTIWIDETVETLAERLKKEKAHRPLIKDLGDDELLHFLTIKLHDRKKIYSKAHHHLQGNQISERSFTEIIEAHV